MLINQANLTAITRNFRAIVANTIQKATPIYPLISTKIPSQTAVEDYSWLGSIPRVREWLDERTHQKLGGFTWQVRNRDWELTIDVDRNDIEDDRLGIYKPLAEEAAAEFALHPDRLLVEMINANGVCFDGQNMFANAHPAPGGPSALTFDNNTALDFSRVNLMAAIDVMAGWTDNEGRNLKAWPTHLMITQHDAFLAKEILESSNLIVAGATDVVRGDANVLKGLLQIIVNNDLTAGSWYLFDCSKPLKPFVFQDRRGVMSVKADSPQDTNYFERKIISFGLDARYNTGFLLPWLAMKNQP